MWIFLILLNIVNKLSFVIILRAMIICLNEQTINFAIEEDVIKDIVWKTFKKFQDVLCDFFISVLCIYFSLIFFSTSEL